MRTRMLSLLPAFLVAACVPVAHRSAHLQHVVLVELAHDADVPLMRADTERILPTIPTVRHWVCGAPVETGRPQVSRDYDLGILVEFDSVDDYRAFLEDPAHQALVRTWRPRWKRATIVDFAP
ncbi:MAG: Dabb family protein [Deltaproteobacteria bacterium]